MVSIVDAGMGRYIGRKQSVDREYGAKCSQRAEYGHEGECSQRTSSLQEQDVVQDLV